MDTVINRMLKNVIECSRMLKNVIEFLGMIVQSAKHLTMNIDVEIDGLKVSHDEK